MIQLLPKWYRVAAVTELKEETLEKRSATILKVASGKDYKLLYNCIRLFIGIPVKDKDFQQTFSNAIFADDSMFVDEDVELEKRVIAGAIVYEAIQKSDFSLTVALLVKTAIFGIDEDTFINKDIIQHAIDYLNKEADNDRKPTNLPIKSITYAVPKETEISDETYVSVIQSLATNFKTLLTNFNNNKENLSNRIEILEEESDIHWWLFRSYSSLKKCPISRLSPLEAPIVIALELAAMIKIYPAPQNCNAFLERMLQSVENAGDKSSIKTYLDNWYEHDTDQLLIHSFDDVSNLLPLYTAYSKIVENGSKDGWTNMFENNAAIKASDSFTPLEFATQVFNERILLYFNN